MKLLSFLFIITFFSCNNNEIKPSIVKDKFSSNIPLDSTVNYFPNNLLFDSGNNEISVDSFVRKWYSETLFNLKEPILYNYMGEGEAIRFVWLRSFENPIIIRMNKFNDTVSANIKEYKIKLQESEPPMILKDTLIALDIKNWQVSLSMLQTNNFWKANTIDTSGLLKSVKDGAPWFLECRLHNKYHFIDRWDDGHMASRDLNLYVPELIRIGEKYVRIKSSR